jgi:hypothetical protein
MTMTDLDHTVSFFRRAVTSAGLASVLGLAACAVPTGSAPGGDGPGAGKADGKRGGCAVELVSIANQPESEKNCDSRCNYDFRAYVDVDEELSANGWEPVLSYRQEKDDGCVFFCDDDGEPGTLEGEVEAWNQVERDVPAGKHRYKLYWSFRTTSNEPIEVSTKLVLGNSREQSGGTYELIPGRGFEEIGSCGTQVTEADVGVGIELSNDAEAACGSANWGSVASRFTYDARSRDMAKRNLCLGVTDDDPDAAARDLKVHYRFEDGRDFESIEAEALFHERYQRYNSRARVRLSQLDPFGARGCDDRVLFSEEDGVQRARMQYYVTSNGERVFPTDAETYTIGFTYEDGDPNGAPCGGSDREWETFEPEVLEATITDAGEGLPTTGDGYSPLCEAGTPDARVPGTVNTISIPSDFGRPLDAEVDIRLWHHWHGDLWIALEHRPAYSSDRCAGNDGFCTIREFAQCTLNGRGDLQLSVDPSYITGHEAGGVWRLVVRDYWHDYSGWEGEEYVEKFEIRLLRR